MQLILKYHGELSKYFSDDPEDNSIKIDINTNDSVYSIIERFKIPRDNISLVLVNGINVNHEDCDKYHFNDGDTLAVWPVTP